MSSIDPDIANLWESFHNLVNMSSPDLRAWLGTRSQSADDYLYDPDVDVLDLGPRVLTVLERRRVDLTDADLAVMRQVMDVVPAWLANPRDGDDRWRHSLMSLGHDPLRADSPRGSDAAALGS